MSAAVSSFRLTGWHVLAMVVGFFAVVIAVDVSFAVFAYRTFPGQVSVTPYEDGLLYNQRLAQEAAQARLGWRAAASATDKGVAFEFVDAKGAPVTDLSVTVTLQRPATEAGRRTLTLKETAPGRYEAASPHLTGAWDVHAEASDARTRSFVADRRLVWP